MRRLVSLWRNLFRRRDVERDLDDEVRAMVDVLVAEKVRAGMPVDEARRRARLELDGVEPVKEHVRSVRAGATVESVFQDVRYAARRLRQSPLFTLTAVLSLAIGIGANTAVFTIANGLLLHRPVGVGEPERLVEIGRKLDGLTAGFNPGSYPDYLDIRRRTTTLEDLYAQPMFPQTLSLATADSVERVFASAVTTNYFTVLRARAAVGRLFGAGDSDQPGASPIVVLSHRFWLRRFNGDAAVVGRTVRINGQPMTVVGVASEGFKGTGVFALDVWIPLGMWGYANADQQQAILGQRASGWLIMGGRLKPGATRAQAAADLDAISAQLQREYSDEPSRGYRVLDSAPTAGNRMLAAGVVVFLGIVVAMVLTIACANVAGLLLTRASARTREIALRLAIGAARVRLVRQLLTETTLLFLIAAAASILVARVMTRVLLSLLPALPMPFDIALTVDWRAMGFAVIVAVAAALLCGIAPALRTSRADVSTALKDFESTVGGRLRVRDALVVMQVAVSLLLLTVGGLFTRALLSAGTGLGFDATNVEVASFDLSMAGYTEVSGREFARAVTDRVRQLPQVAAATTATSLPLALETLGFGIEVPGRTSPGAPRVSGVSANVVEPGLFNTLRIPLAAGRDFNDGDTLSAPRVAIVGEGAARLFWPGEDPIGRQLIRHEGSGGSRTTTTLQVVGVARDIHYSSVSSGSTPFVYVPLQQYYTSSLRLIVRTRDGRSVGGAIRDVVRSMNPNLPVLAVQTLDDATAVGLVPQRVAASVAASMGVIGLLLAAIGIYGVTANNVARRTRELAIRLALGARHQDVTRMVLRHGVVLMIVGTVAGLILAAISGQVLSMLLVGVSAIDPMTFAVVVGTCAAVAAIACYVPVQRVLHLQAMDALREE